MSDTKEELINQICDLITATGTNTELLKNKLAILLHPYKIDTECQELSTDVKSEDLKAYQMYFISKKIEGLSERSLRNYKIVVDEFLSFIKKPLKDITPNDVRYYLAFYQEKTKCSNSYNDTKRRYLSSFFTWLENEEYIRKSPLKIIKKIKCDKKVKLPFKPDEVEKLRDAIKKVSVDSLKSKSVNEYISKLTSKRNIAILEVLLSTGMRVGELSELKIEDLNMVEGKIKVFGKGAKERICYLNEIAKMRLEEYLSFKKDKSPYVFTHIFEKDLRGKSTKLGIAGIETMIKKVGKEAGVNDVHPHRFRRTSATWCLRRGMNIEQVRLMLGHEKIETTLLYAMTDNDDLQMSHKKYMN